MYEYYYRNRPPGFACQPGGFDVQSREYWRPRKYVNGVPYHGKVSYPEPLSREDINCYELRPADPVEHAEFIFWLVAHQTKGNRAWMREVYLNMDRARLEEDARCDMFAQAALTILDAQKESENVSP